MVVSLSTISLHRHPFLHHPSTKTFRSPYRRLNTRTPYRPRCIARAYFNRHLSSFLLPFMVEASRAACCSWYQCWRWEGIVVRQDFSIEDWWGQCQSPPGWITELRGIDVLATRVNTGNDSACSVVAKKMFVSCVNIRKFLVRLLEYTVVGLPCGVIVIMYSTVLATIYKGEPMRRQQLTTINHSLRAIYFNRLWARSRSITST